MSAKIETGFARQRPGWRPLCWPLHYTPSHVQMHLFPLFAYFRMRGVLVARGTKLLELNFSLNKFDIFTRPIIRTLALGTSQFYCIIL